MHLSFFFWEMHPSSVLLLLTLLSAKAGAYRGLFWSTNASGPATPWGNFNSLRCAPERTAAPTGLIIPIHGWHRSCWQLGAALQMSGCYGFSAQGEPSPRLFGRKAKIHQAMVGCLTAFRWFLTTLGAFHKITLLSHVKSNQLLNSWCYIL